LKLIMRDERLPRPLRWAAAFALLPVPGPVDEVVLLLVAPVVALLYRKPLADAWRRAVESPQPTGGEQPCGR